MKNIKTLLVLALSCIMIIGMTACGTTEKTTTSKPTTEVEGTVEETPDVTESPETEVAGSNVLEGKTVGFSQTDSMSSWRTTESDSIQQAVEAAGGTFIIKDAGGDIATQESDIRDLVSANVDYLVVAPLEDNGLQNALQEAMESEIPVILVDRMIDGEVGVHFTTAIRSDFVWEGEQAAKAVMAALPEGGNIVIINGGYDSSTSTDRQEGFVSALDPEKYIVIAEQDGEWLMDKAQAVMENILQAQGGENIDVVYAVTDDMIQGSKRAIESGGLKPGVDILTVGIDGTRAALDDIAAGVQLASVTCSPYFGPIVVETITDIISGNEIATSITVEDILYTSDNVDVEQGF